MQSINFFVGFVLIVIMENINTQENIPHPNPKKQWGVAPFLFGTGYK